MTGNAGPILLITIRDGPLGNLWGGGGGGKGAMYKKIVAQGNEKKFNARQLTLKKYSYYGQKRFIQGIW